MNKTTGWAALYYVALTVVGAFLLLNLMITVLFEASWAGLGSLQLCLHAPVAVACFCAWLQLCSLRAAPAKPPATLTGMLAWAALLAALPKRRETDGEA